MTRCNCDCDCDGCFDSAPDVKKIKVLKLTDTAKLPTKSNGNMCYDVYADESVNIIQGKVTVVKTGIKLAVPEGFHYSIRPRSGLAAKNGIQVLAGQIDGSYRGELLICLTTVLNEVYSISKGDKIAQFKIEKDETFPVVEVSSVEELGETDRGDKGFGSSGKT
jgi:dUTP pyrophosphatase